MTAPRRLQLRRGNTTAISTYVGAPGELVVNTTTNTLYLHDGSTVGGYATTINVATITNQIASTEANIILANVGMRGYVDLGNTIQVAAILSANLGIKGYVDLGNTIQSEQLTAANTAWTANASAQQSLIANLQASAYSNVNVASYLSSVGIGSSYSNVNTAAYLGANYYITSNTANLSTYAWASNVTTANAGIKGYVDLANTIQSAQISAANVGIIGYIDLANTIQSGQVGAANLAITAANVGMKGYVDSQSFYSNAKVATYLPTYSGNISANISKAGHTWTFGTDGKLTFAGTLTNGATFDGNDFTAAPNSFVEFAGYTGNTYVGLDNDSVFIQTNWNTAGKQWTFGTDGTTLFPDQAIDGGTAPIELKSRSWSQLTYNNSDMNQQPNKNHSTTFYVEGGDALLEIFRWDSGNVMQHRQWTFSSDGSLSLPDTGSITFPDNTVQTTAYTGAGSYSNVQVATYLPTYTGNIANIRLGNSGVLTFADGTTQTTAGGSSYSNVQVATYLPTYAGIVSASLVNTSGNILSTGLSVFGNTRIGLAGAVSGQFHTIVGNITQTSSGGAVYINTTGNVLAAAVVAGAVTTTGTMAVNSATGITTNQGTFLLANATATTINMGGAATTINLGITTSATGNVFVGGQIGSNAYNLTLRANGTYNIASSINSNGGFNSPPYANQAVIGGTGTGMTANYSATGGYLTTLTIYNVGTGYRNGDVISVPGGIAGNSFVLQNYNSGKTSTAIGTALYTFGIDGNLTAPGNITIASNSSYFIGNTIGTTASYTGNVSANYFTGNGALLTGVAIKTTGSWTVPTGNSTQSFTVPASGTYQLWVDCNIPNGILAWNATATVTNTNVPVVGAQYAWVYNGGGTPVDFTSIPNQFTGTGNTIVRSSTAPSATTNRFDFGINNTSGGNITVRYGYVSIS